jgi:hypothetical protein
LGPTSSAEASGANVKEEKSETYSNDMTEAMGAGKFGHSVPSLSMRKYESQLGRHLWSYTLKAAY